jgi:ferredoxin
MAEYGGVVMENVVFFFTGTGNSLKAAKAIGRELGNCEIVSMAKPYNLTRQYDSIGFVYPTYFWGLPKRVIEFVESIKLDGNKNAYYYSVATYGGSAGNAVYQLYELLRDKHGIRLNYGQRLRMFSNYVVIYDMSEKVTGITEQSNKRLVPIVDSIKKRKNRRISGATKIFQFINRDFVAKVSAMDKDFSVNGDCTGCGICEKVCPAQNIELVNNRPQYRHRCEQCVACIQFCPSRAINYKDATQGRRRYTNPEITYQELYEYNRR